MNAFRTVALSVVLGLALVACGSPSEQPPAGAGAGGGSLPSDPGSPVTITPEPGSSVHDVGGRPQRVRPRPGMDDPRPIGWEKARQTPDGRHLRVVYWSGVEPCSVLDRVDVGYEAERIVVTVYEGSDPEHKESACIELALQKVVRVALQEAVDGRKIVDGAP